MSDAGILFTFIAASGAIVVAPQAAQALVPTRTLGEGRRAGIQIQATGGVLVGLGLRLMCVERP